MKLRGKEIKNFGEPLVVAEIGQNHNGSIKIAKDLILRAKEAGCDYVKFQCWDKDSLFVESFYKDKAGDDFLKTKNLEETLDLLSLNRDNIEEIIECCRNAGIGFVSTPVSNAYVDLLADNDVDFIKIASFDLNNLGFLEYVASKGRPIVLSTGLGTLQEIEEAVNTIFSTGNRDLVLLHCVAAYPPKDENVNLNNIDLLRDYFELPVGYSDHTTGFTTCLAAIAKGACIIEKHFTFDNSIVSGDHPLSADPDEMKVIVEEGKRVSTALGQYKRILSDDDKKYKQILRRSIVSVRNIQKGEIISMDVIDFKRPGTGIQIGELPYLLNRKAKRNIHENEIITWDDVE